MSATNFKPASKQESTPNKVQPATHSAVKREPEFDHGFHAAIPRMVRTGYPDLSATQKWLYVCLKDLAGETGTCFRALRTLEQETGISISMISTSIVALHKAGLIHAEKKKRSAGGKEVWHITIVDIWTANGKVHPTKKRSQSEHSGQERSLDEQECSHSEQTSKNVLSANKNVLSANKTTGECSFSEQECSLCETEEGREKKDHFEEGREKKAVTTPTVTKPATDDSLSLSPSQKASSQETPPPAASLEEKLTDEGIDFLRGWEARYGKLPLTEKIVEALNYLGTRIKTTTALESCYNYTYTCLKDFAQSQHREAVPPGPGNLVKKYDEWLSVEKRRTQEKEQAAVHACSGTASLTNSTKERLAGAELPPLTFVQLPRKPRGRRVEIAR